MAVAREAVHDEHKLGFIQRYIFSQDHKIIGIQYMMTSLFMAAVGGVVAMLIRMELGWPGGHWGVARWLFPGGVSSAGGAKTAFFLSLVPTPRPIMFFFLVPTAPTCRAPNFSLPLSIWRPGQALPFPNPPS